MTDSSYRDKRQGEYEKLISNLNYMFMRKNVTLLLILVSVITCKQPPQTKTGSYDDQKQFIDSNEVTNDFYDNTETFTFTIPEVSIGGEIANPGIVDFSSLSRHSVIVKETLLDPDGGTGSSEPSGTMVIPCSISLRMLLFRKRMKRNSIQLSTFSSRLRMRQAKSLYSAGGRSIIPITCIK
jgi:hypothetical protein